MNTLDRNGITLAYQEAGSGTSPVLLVHGFGSDHTFLLGKTPQHVLASSFRNHVTEYDASAAIEASRLPIAYIGAASPMADVNRFRQLRPDLIVGQTIGSGHFSPRLVPAQINAMLERFV
jgi:hypothetical protein